LSRFVPPIEVVTPERFQGRECQVVLVSLTRSHTHRAVSFAPTLRSLALGLTRARAQLILFGDPGTLLRRSQWEGALDQLDAAAAAAERAIITRLVRYLEGQGGWQHAFELRSGALASSCV
jgi:hypothetical protein